MMTKNKTNLKRLLSAMDTMSVDAIDRETVKRFKVLIETTSSDITKTMLNDLQKNTKNVDISGIDESIQPYIRHFLLMLKRAAKKK